jgi:K+-sensing histidine kinase KdpD
VAATDATGLRRWAIVVLGTGPVVEGVEIVSSEEWSEPLLARVFKSAVAQHQLLREKARLEGDLRTLAYRISHDLRTPLGGIVSAGEVLKEVLLEKDPSSAPLTQPIFHSTDELMKLIERVSFLLKASVNRPAKARLAMGEVVGAVLQRLEGRIIRKGASVSQPDDWPEVTGVASWLETVWWNLVANALQHAGGSPRIQMGWSRQNDEYRFWIRDGGGGVAAEKRQELFQPFNLLHLPNGTRGVGLSIVRRLVELQGGHCGYEFSSEDGSTFFFILPVESDTKPPPSAIRGHGPDLL